MKKKQYILKKAVNNIHSENLRKCIKPIKKTKNIQSANNSIYLTKKISYKSYNHCPKIKTALSSFEISNKKNEEKYYWFAAYDKLIKKKKLLKIFSFYNLASKNSIALGDNNLYEQYSQIKEKKLIINDYEIYFLKNMNTKPFIRKNEGKKIYVKLYLLTMKQINMIFSYINKIEYDNYMPNLDDIDTKAKFINIVNKENIDIDYSTSFFLGYFMNIRILSFSRVINSNNELNINNNINNVIELELNPNSKKIAKLIKILLIDFPEHSKEYFINYLFTYLNYNINSSKINDKNITKKMNEINHLLISQKKSLYKINTSGIDSGRGIGYKPQELSFSPYLSSFTNNISNKLSSNLNNNTNNILNNITGNLGSISYNPSNFDFSSDFFVSMKRNDDNLNKKLNSIKSLSNHNTNSNNSQIKVNNNKNESDNKKNIMNNNNKKTESKISNFSVEKDSKRDKNNIKISVNKKFNLTLGNRNRKNFLNIIEEKKNLKSYTIKNIPGLLSKNKISINPKHRNTFTKIIKKPKLSLDIKYHDHINNFSKIVYNSTYNFKNDNKENNAGVSNFTEIYKKDICNNIIKTKRKIFSLNVNKSSNLKGEDIFQKSERFQKNSNSSFMYILDKNGVSSFDSRNIRKSIMSRLSNNQLIHK